MLGRAAVGKRRWALLPPCTWVCMSSARSRAPRERMRLANALTSGASLIATAK